MIDLGTVQPGSTVRIPFSSFDKDDGSSITMTNFAVADILVYKDGSTTERASTSGYTATTDFDSKTGKHLAIIDLADNTTADFFAAGSEYLVAIDAVTVDAVTTGGWIARFRIGYPSAVLDTTIATLASQTSFTLATGPAEDDALKDMWAIIHDAASAVQKSRVVISAYTGSTKTVTLAASATFTVAAKDNISIMGPMPLQPTTINNRLDVTATGAAGIDFGNVENPTTTLALSGTTVKAVTDAVTLPASASINITGNITGNLTGSVGSVSGNVGGNVVGSVGSVPDSAGVTTLLGRIPAALFSGITSLAEWLGLLAGKQSGNATARTELRATGAGSGTYDETTDSLEAARDNIGTAGAALTTIDVGKINGSTAAAVRLALSANTIIPGTVDTVTNGHTPTTVEFQADDITEATSDHYNGRVIIFTSGTLLGQATSISDYSNVGGIGQFTVVALTEAPANNDTFIIV